jgi:hypothetical protein
VRGLGIAETHTGAFFDDAVFWCALPLEHDYQIPLPKLGNGDLFIRGRVSRGDACDLG